MLNIDTSFLLKPNPPAKGEKDNGEGWGYMDPNNPHILKIFQELKNKLSPKNIFEIGMFAGHSTVSFLQIWPQSNVQSCDPGIFSQRSYKNIEEKYPDRFKFYSKKPDPRNLNPIDLLFIDGNHSYDSVMKDIAFMRVLKPKWVLFDNVEVYGVRKAIREMGYDAEDLDPQYYFYINTHKGKRNPGIMMLLEYVK